MLLKDLIFSFRNIQKNRLTAFINVLGLTIGISACLVIFLIVNYELSYERFRADRDQIYRVYSQFSGLNSNANRGVPTGFSDALKEGQFAGVEAIADFHIFKSKVEIQNKNQEPKNLGRYEGIIIASPGYFDVFQYEWLAGNSEKALAEPLQVVLTESRARVYFEDASLSDMIGREVIYRDSLVATVSGIVKDTKENTDLNFTDFISMSTIENTWLKKSFFLHDWFSLNSSSQLFFKAAPGTSLATLQEHMNNISAQYDKVNKNPDRKNTPSLQPLSQLHFNSEMGIFDYSRSVPEKSTLQILGLIAVLLLVIAAINFINLVTAQASRRAREVGVRKVLGSSRFRLVNQFLMESFILTFIASAMSLLLSAEVLSFFSEFFPTDLKLNVLSPTILIFSATCIVVVTLLAGIYPAFVLSSVQPVVALKNSVHMNSNSSGTFWIRKGLTVFQFSVSNILIISTLAISLQIGYMLNKDLGFATDSIVYFDTPWWEKSAKKQLLKNELSQIPEIDALTLQSSPPSSDGWSTSTFEFDNGKEVLKDNVYLKQADTAYLNVYNIQLLAGRNLHQSDIPEECLINETYMQKLGFTDPHEVLGKVVSKLTIVGVVKDFHVRSLHTAIEPMAIFSSLQGQSSFGMRLRSENGKISDLQSTMAKVEASWMKIYPDQKFTYTFLDETLKRFYENEQRTGKIARIATGIALLISCLGLFGLSSFRVIQRTKEIGIRKVLGASVRSILVLLSTDFLILVVVAFVVSSPIAYYASEQWLNNFAYKMDMGPWIFILAGISSLITAFLTISIKTLGAANANPVKSLRYE
ncbi:MAG: FtsX-like permease family protein [Cyclobacteriaceae bacterium]|nr:FtsX-like permease family protein [Cyclobacteriaceae bacterium]